MRVVVTEHEEDLATTAAFGEPAPLLLNPGTRIGHYEVLALLGSGGMGRVYRARDTTLGRDVALKALTRSFRDEPSNLRRFEREARVLAALNHPGIATIHGLEELDGAPYLVLELIAGETFLDRLKRGPLPVAEAIAVAIQVADALEEAHRRGVVHRDLKPSNVMLTDGGRVKVLDFGLAKTVARSKGDGAEVIPTEITTASGTALGTAPYMSPEQVRGDEVDTQSDIWAFGCLLYEMLSGQRAFKGRSLPEIAAAILRDEVDWSFLPADTPRTVQRLLRRCLRRDWHARLRAIGDARMELEDLSAQEEDGPKTPRGWARWIPWTVSAAAVAVAAVALWRANPAPRVSDIRLSLELPAAVALPDDYPAPFAVSPDSSRILFVGIEGETRRLYVRALDELVADVLPGTEGAFQPFFSPDGRWVGFFADRWLRKVPLDGGPPIALAEVGGNPRGAAWAPGGTIVLSPSQTSGLQQVSDAGGTPAVLTPLDGVAQDISHRWPDVLPGGRWVLYTAASEESNYNEARLEAFARDGRAPSDPGRRELRPHAPGGRAGVRAGWAAPHRAPGARSTGRTRRARSAGGRHPLRPSQRRRPPGRVPLGTLIYSPAEATVPERYLAWLDRKGRLSRLLDTPRIFGQLRLSGDGSRVALRIGNRDNSDLWSLDLASGTLSRLSSEISPQRPAWRPDGRGVTVAAEGGGRWRLLTLPLGAEAPAGILLEGRDRMYPNDWTPDGRALVFQVRATAGGWDLALLDADPSGRAAGPPRTLVATPFQEANAAVSPDGKLLAYRVGRARRHLPDLRPFVPRRRSEDPRVDGRGASSPVGPGWTPVRTGRLPRGNSKPFG